MSDFMKKIFALLFIFICIAGVSGCAEENVSFFIEQETKDLYNGKINDLLKKEHWNFDINNISYEQGTVPDERVTGFEEIKRASEIDNFDFESNKGKSAIFASVKIYHFNNDEAGKASFYFVSDEIVCGFYISGNNIFALSEINIFTDDVFDGKSENLQEQVSYNEISIYEMFDGFDDYYAGNSVVGDISDDKVKFFKFTDNKFVLDKELDFSKENLYPMDIAFNDNGSIAILLGQKKKSQHEIMYSQQEIQEMKENGLTDDEINGSDIILSDRIVFLKPDYTNEFDMCKLDVSSYGSITYTDGQVFASRGKGIDVFSNNNGKFAKTKQYLIKQWVEKIKVSDIDNDGKKEFIMTDNTNLFIYHLVDCPVLIWKTHLSIESMEKRFYIDDTNGDGIKEIFVSDSDLKTSAKYVLMDFGFKPISLDYGMKCIPGDFNGDGKVDYIIADNNDDTYKLFLHN